MNNQQASFWLRAAGLFLFLAVALGAFGAHGLQSVFNPKQLEVWHKAVNYQVIHGFALVAIGVLLAVFPKAEAFWQKAGWSFLVGILLFSGSLYLWAASQLHFLVLLTPLGGTAFLIGWAFFFLGARKISSI